MTLIHGLHIVRSAKTQEKGKELRSFGLTSCRRKERTAFWVVYSSNKSYENPEHENAYHSSSHHVVTVTIQFNSSLVRWIEWIFTPRKAFTRFCPVDFISTRRHSHFRDTNFRAFYTCAFASKI
ncbi:LOW QUALITY PROTEIN: hypothetical protein PanWU01x14_162780 [Parasponia andersonii]|uniref:Uncharacterized protein n=1 Tax=Parasponia andersonii TaxID=3476 RepID=A0A2P5CD26_PARAD|nr:LOW QUALITY PROTEIN: hypothetical protein PanWU01x14_162780 [Parasponia andersonii]